MGSQYLNQPQLFQDIATFEKGLSSTEIRAFSVLSSAVSSNNIFGNYIGAVNLYNLSGTQINNIVSTLSSTAIGGTFIGDGTRLSVTYLPQQREINTFVVQNSATMRVQVLTASRVHAEYFGNQAFPAVSSTLITDGIIRGQSVFNGIYYGDGINLHGVIPGQSAINLLVGSISATPTFETLRVQKNTTTSLFASGSFVGINTPIPNTNLTVVGNISATDFIYGDGTYLRGITTGNRRFDYVPGENEISYSGTTNLPTVTTSQSAWKIIKIEYTADGGIVNIGAATNVAWVERKQPWVKYS